MTENNKSLGWLKSIGLVLLSVQFLASCGGASVTGNNELDFVPAQTGDIVESSISSVDFSQTGYVEGQVEVSGNDPITYGMYIPQIFEGEKVPLVLALHGRGGTGTGYMKYFIEPALSELGAIMIAPNVPGDGDWLDSYSEWKTIEIMEYAIKHWPVDPERVVITGYSMGGTGAWNILTIKPGMFSAAIPMAATPKPWVRQPTTLVPTYVIHPEKDTFFPLDDITEQVAELRDQGADIEFVIVPDTAHEEIFETMPYLYDTIDWLQNTIWQ